MSTALPCTWAEYLGGSTQRVASLYDPYFLIASFSSRCCLAALRRADVILIVMPSARAAAIARFRRDRSFGDRPSMLSSRGTGRVVFAGVDLVGVAEGFLDGVEDGLVCGSDGVA